MPSNAKREPLYYACVEALSFITQLRDDSDDEQRTADECAEEGNTCGLRMCSDYGCLAMKQAELREAIQDHQKAEATHAD